MDKASWAVPGGSWGGPISKRLTQSVLCWSAFERPDARVVAAAAWAGAFGVLDVGRDRAAALRALNRLAGTLPDGFGVRIPDGVEFHPRSLPEDVSLVVLPAGAPVEPWQPRTVLVQVVSTDEARAAVARGADGIVAKGSESGGRVGDEGTFVLLQRLVSELDVPIWAQGGIGLHTAPACIAGGAAGVVLDAQLALVSESTLPDDVRAAARAMDGSETRLVRGHRVYTRPDLPLAEDDVPARLGADGLATHVLPAGQDAAFAGPLAERFETTAGVVRAVKAAMGENPRRARALQPLAPGSALARAHGIRYPLVQGPMTRVSDRVAFAEAVADAGGLPFLALALLRAAEVRRLLDAAAERLDGRAWGVGVLGFVPPELREEQLAVIRSVRPPVALIAGGRPAQARPLEDDGIATYLHVPSPALLDLFLKHGARRFVFEGRECGGHVGPRTSFALWEQQVERLLAFEAAGDLSVLFAGGIHDARSAAMVSTLAAPLAQRGARIGALMGTAYLFTEEAVASGAIRPTFQEAALACDRTVLLETAPGHATRCAETPYVRAFEAAKRDLEAEGRPQDEVWTALERLNVGRLRIASKGLRREGDELVAVDDEDQRRDGMVMLGQAAALRAERTTIEQLHLEVSERSVDVLDRVAPDMPRPRAAPADVAIVGMAAVLPGAADLERYWANVVGGVDSVTEVARERWNHELYFDPEGKGSDDRTPSKWGGFVPTVAFDPAAYGIPPNSLAAIEPVQLLALEVARRALRDAGYDGRDFDRERTAVLFGADSGSDLTAAYTTRAFWKQYAGPLSEELAAALPTLTEDSFPGVLANVIAGRIANRLDLGGANYTVDAACASSLAAVDLAVKELRTGTADMVVCGAADLHCAINDFLLFASVQALSPTGRCRTFDAKADGIALGEGVAAIVLKRLEDAERDGDRIYAVVKGVGSSSDGKSLGLTAPRREGQVRALERAYEAAGVSPADVGLVEAHGTGTVVGDRTELQTLDDVFTAAEAKPGSAALGSVKSQIGHTKCAAGLAGLIKVTLALERGVLPPTLHVEAPNPAWRPEESPFALNSSAQPWTGRSRTAAVSAFGFGGTNYHLVVEGRDQAEAGLPEWPVELFLFHGETETDVRARVELVLARLDEGDAWTLRDLARSVSAGAGPVQLAVVASDRDDLRAKLTGERNEGVHRRTDALGDEPKVAFLFPGQGSQRVGMLRELFVAFPHLRRFLELGPAWAERIFPPTAWSEEVRAAQRTALTDTRVAQPALGIAGLAAADVLDRVGVRPDALGGHSYGELVALAVAGALDERELLELSAVRGECILAAAARASDGDPGTMAAVAATADTVRAQLDDGVVVANENAPDQTVIAGPTERVDAAIERLAAAGVAARRLPVACAFHSPLVEAAGAAFAEHLEGKELRAPTLPVYSNTTTQPHGDDPDQLRAALAEHVRRPVRFAAEVEQMYADGVRVFVEAGPGRILTGLVSRTLGERPHLAVACDDPSGSSLVTLLDALARLAVHGVPFDADRLFDGRGADRLDLATAPSRRPPDTAWWVDGHRAWPVKGEPPAHGLRPMLEPVASAAPKSPPPGADRETVVLEYLRSVRELVDAQRRVVLAYLGETSVEAIEPPRPFDARSNSLVHGGETVDARPPAPPLPARARSSDVEPPASPEEALLAVVSERTGYPVEMLGLDLDLEAELSIDSIKRIEILGALGEQLGLTAGAEAVPEELAGAKTLRAILEWFGATAAAPAGAPAPAIPDGLTRFVLELADAGPATPNGASLASKRFTIVGSGTGVQAALAALLEARGATISSDPDGADGLVDLTPLGAVSAGTVKGLFARVQAAVLGGAHWIVVVTSLGGTFGRSLSGSSPPEGGGFGGLLKTVAKEYPERRIRVVDVGAGADHDAVAQAILGELLAADVLAEVGHVDDARYLLRPVAAERNGGGGGVALGPESVVLVTGGARGITARAAVELARRTGCRLELVGRSPEPAASEEDAELAAAATLVEIRRLLAARNGSHGPAALEAAARRVLADREIRATLATLADEGVEVRYHVVDVRDAGALEALIDDVYARHGRLDGVVHGAGVIEDRLLRDKTDDSFARVFDTKVAPALTLARKLRDDVQFMAFFSSISGAFGNRGQSDYAAANDFLDKLALALNGRLPGRVFSIVWGPWAGGGMVSPELEREYGRRGIGLIDPDEGARGFVDELLHGEPGDAQVILMRGDVEALR